MTIDKYIKKEAFKIVIARDGAVGKTSTAKRLAGNLIINERKTVQLKNIVKIYYI